MTPTEIGLVQGSFEAVKPIADKAAALFYGRLFEIAPEVKPLFSYGVKPEHYNKVGTALLWTLEQGLGEAYTPEVDAAWKHTYQILSDAMIGAAYGQAAE